LQQVYQQADILLLLLDQVYPGGDYQHPLVLLALRAQQRLSQVLVLLPLLVLPQQRLLLPRPYHHWLIVLSLH
jgi:hypothetical protein